MLFASHLSHLRGCAQRCLAELVIALQCDGRVLPIVSVPAEGELSVELERHGVSCHVVPTPLWTPWDRSIFTGRFPGESTLRRVRRSLALLARSRPYSALVRRIDPDVVVTNTVTTPTPAIVAAAQGVAHCWWIHEVGAPDHLRFLLGVRTSQRLIGALSARVIVNSQAVAHHYRRRVGSHKIRVIMPDVPRLKATENRVEPGELRVLSLGAQSRAKGTELALHALSMLQH